ncbi:MAG TPA: diacylglycerol kinase family protein, partial [Hydrogenophaga sp.]|nr:diacylglycerol kinase family protein [Hydrogenophaga sp.]
MAVCPEIDLASPLQFVINAAAGSGEAETEREAIEAALSATGRRGELLFSRPDDLAGAAHKAAKQAFTSRTAVVAVGGDGTINTVAQAAHAVGCAMGVVPRGTFNYFARAHGIPADTAIAARLLLDWAPQPVQVAAVNDRVFLVNASLGMYPALLEDREAYKARFGRSRWVAFWAASATLLRAQRKLRLQIEQGDLTRHVRTLTLFVGNNQLQLEQLGLQQQPSAESGPVLAPENGRLTAVMLRPIGTLEMMRLMMRGAMGTLGEAQSVDHFEFERMLVKPARTPGLRSVKVAFDGEIARMRAPLDFRVLEKPLYLLMPHASDKATEPA